MKAIYKKCLWNSARRIWGENVDWWLLCDNDTRHKAGITIQWLNENYVRRRIDFPPKSPDLNAIENLFFYLARAVETHNPTTQEELENAIRIEWAKIPLNLLKNLAHSMPKRCKEVIMHKGHKTLFIFMKTH